MTTKRLAKEEDVRRILQDKLGLSLHKKKLEVVQGVEHEFDIVSEDETIIGEVKTSEPNKIRKTDYLRSATLGDLSRDCLLLLAPRTAKRRILALTDEVVYRKFRESVYGKVAAAKGVDILYVKV